MNKFEQVMYSIIEKLWKMTPKEIKEFKTIYVKELDKRGFSERVIKAAIMVVEATLQVKEEREHEAD